MRWRASKLATAMAAAVALAQPAAAQPDGDAAPSDPVAATVGDYFEELERVGLVSVDTGSRAALRAELDEAESLLSGGNPMAAAIALYAIVESPRFTDFEDFVEYQNAEYDLGVALAASGAYDSSLNYLTRAVARGPGNLYFAPANRRAVDIALETRDYEGVLERLESVKLDDPLPPSIAGERAYLRAHHHYDRGQYTAAEGELVKIDRKSRLFSSALYMRGVIRARRGEYRAATDALCEIVSTPDSDKYTFVVDDRYFTVKDLARLGLGRVAHEQERYNDAYYHYFQIPEDSERLPEALFEAAWSMYQKRELATARDLVGEFLKNYEDSPLVPEAMLLAGYVELADCKFVKAQEYFDRLVTQVEPVVAEVDRTLKSANARRKLFDKALDRRRQQRAAGGKRVAAPAKTPAQRALAYLQIDPGFARLEEAVAGMVSATGDAPHARRTWSNLLRRVGGQKVTSVDEGKSYEQEELDDANALVADVRRLQDDLVRARAELRRGVRAKTLPADAAREERARLDQLERDIAALETKAVAAVAAVDATALEKADPQLRALMSRDIEGAAALERDTQAFVARLRTESERLSKASLERLHTDLRRAVDKARLGKIDAVIGQKRRLDIEVQDLAAGRYPPELHGRLWEQGLIGDDEQYWPYEGEYWADEYEGYR